MPAWDWIKTHIGIMPLVVLALALTATFGSWYTVDRALSARNDVRFSEEVEAATNAVVERLRAYELMLRGGAGLFFASERVSRDEFRTYVDILNLQETYPGIQGFGFIASVTAADLAAHVGAVRAEGLANYTVHPKGGDATKAPVVFLEPTSAQNDRVLGYDMMSEAVRREALERARDTGDAAVSGKVRLLQDFNDEVRVGFMMYLPVYGFGRDPGDVAGRRAALRGFVYAPFRAADLMRETVHPDTALVSFALYDGTSPSPAALLYDGEDGMAASERTQTVAMKAGGRDWTLAFAETPRFAAVTRSSEAEIVAVSGTIVSLILFALTRLMMRTATERQRNAEALLLAENKFLQAQKMESIGQLTGGVAHDFNNLLTVVLGNAEHLVAGLKDNARLRGAAELILGAAEQGAELTGRLLAFARRQPLDPAPTDVSKLVSSMDALLRRTIGANIDIQIVRGGGLWEAMVDAPQLESALLNLCINARDAMPNGGKLTIEIANASLDHAYAAEHAEVTAGQYLMIAVSDTGTGMAPDVVARAFEPFYTTKPAGQGSGLGLSMVYGFTKQSKGHVKIYSEPGQGTTVKIYLPRAIDGAPRKDVPKAAPDMPRGSEKVLVVEDNEMVRGHVAAQLTALGYAVVTAKNGPDALDVLGRDGGIQLLFTDIVMTGGMNGRELADEARKSRPDLPVLFTSGYTENAVVHHGRLDPGVHLLTKPYRQHELAVKVRRVLDEKRGA